MLVDREELLHALSLTIVVPTAGWSQHAPPRKFQLLHLGVLWHQLQHAPTEETALYSVVHEYKYNGTEAQNLLTPC